MVADTTYRHSEGWTLGCYEDLSGAFVFVRQPPSVIRLSRHALLALELCAGRTESAARSKFVEMAGSGKDPDATAAVFDRTLGGLLRQGLLRPTPDAVSTSDDKEDSWT